MQGAVQHDIMHVLLVLFTRSTGGVSALCIAVVRGKVKERRLMKEQCPAE